MLVAPTVQGLGVSLGRPLFWIGAVVDRWGLFVDAGPIQSARFLEWHCRSEAPRREIDRLVQSQRAVVVTDYASEARPAPISDARRLMIVATDPVGTDRQPRPAQRFAVLGSPTLVAAARSGRVRKCTSG